MKGKRLLLALCALLAAHASALELVLEGGAGNAAFDSKSESALGSGEFAGKFYPFFKAAVQGEYTERLFFKGDFSRDPVLRNVLSGDMAFTSGFFTFNIGPTFGIFNSYDEIIQPGLRTGFSLDFPGILFLGAEGGASFGGGGFRTKTAGLWLGFWLPNIVNTLSARVKNYEDSGDALTTVDESVRYEYRADIHAKGYPFGILVNMGYEKISRAYETAAQKDKDVYHMLFLGTEVSFTVKTRYRLIFGYEMPVYSWGGNPLTRKDKLYLFKTWAGVSFIFGE